VVLVWNDTSTGRAVYEVERSLNGTSGWTQVGVTDPNVTFTTYSDTTVLPATAYYYRVRAHDPNLGYSAYSNIRNITTPALPAAPSGLTATPASTTSITLNWTDNSTNETGFKAEQASGDPNDPNTTWAAAAGSPVGVNVKTLTVTGLTINTKYWFRVRAYSTLGGDTAPTNIASATTYALTPPVLSSTSITGNGVAMSWTNGNAGLIVFEVERSLSSTSGFSQIGTTDPNVTTTVYTDTTVAQSTTYYYRVRAHGTAGYSAYSNVLTAAVPALPAAPSNLVAAPVSVTSIKLTWTDNSSGAAGFIVEQASGDPNDPNTTWAQTGARQPAGTLTYTVTGLTSGTTYWFRVRSNNGNGTSAPSNVAFTAPYAYVLPTGLVVTAISGTEIDLTWTDTNAGVTDYQVERSLSPASGFSQVGTVTAGSPTAFNNLGLTPNTTYYYRVRAHGPAGYSAYSTVQGAATPAS